MCATHGQGKPLLALDAARCIMRGPVGLGPVDQGLIDAPRPPPPVATMARRRSRRPRSRARGTASRRAAHLAARLALSVAIGAPASLAGQSLRADPLGTPAAGSRQTRHVVLIVADGLRWQEVVSGADSSLLDAEHGGSWTDADTLRRRYWRPDAVARRHALLPFIWSAVETHGQLLGDQTIGSVARVTNGMAFSYPGYNEMLTGAPDPRINSNGFGPNPNVTVFEWLNGRPDLAGRVAVFATWSTFREIFREERSHLVMQVGWDPPYPRHPTAAQAMVDSLYATTTRLDDEDLYDAFLQIPLLDYVRAARPAALFVGYGETDNWAHAGRYDLVLASAHAVDRYVSQLWATMQAIPEYRDHTTFIITADHGRGSGFVDWKEHGVDQPGSENIWIAVIGPDTPPLGDRAHLPVVTQSQIAATVAAFLGYDYPAANPAAAPALQDVLGAP